MFAPTVVLWYLGIGVVALQISTFATPVHDGGVQQASRLAAGPRNNAHLSQINLSQTLWSSAFLVFSLAWIAVHPNYASPYDSPWMKFRRRLMLVLWALLFPELVLYWSVRQWVGARKIRDKFKDKGWTIVDAHFLQMGGLLIAPVHTPHRQGPQGKTGFFTLTVPLLEELYAQHFKQHISQRSPPALQPQERAESPVSCPIPTPLANIPPPPLSIAIESRIPLVKDYSNHASTSAEQLPPRPTLISLSDIDNYSPPPDSIKPLETLLPLAEASDKDPLSLPLTLPELNDFSLNYLASIHVHLPSSPPPLPCRQSRQSTSTADPKPTQSTNHIATTFPADPLLAGIILLQLVWFVSGCIARIAVGGWRELFLVQVLVLAYISIYLMTIVVWWDKPAIGLAAEPVKVVIMGENRPSKKQEIRKKIDSFEDEGDTKQEFGRRVKDKGKEIERGDGFVGHREDHVLAMLHDPYFGQPTLNYGEREPSSSRGSSIRPSIPSPAFLSAIPKNARVGGVSTDNPEKVHQDSDTFSIAASSINAPDLSTQTFYSLIWKAALIHKPFSRFFHFDRVHEFFLKTTGYDDYSHEYELSTDPTFSNVRHKPDVRVRREGKRHWRRNQSNAVRLGLESEVESDQAIAGLVFGNGYQHRGSGHFTNGEGSGVSESVKGRREAGSGGQSRLPTFYAYVTERGYRSLQEAKVKMLVGVLCGVFFGGVHLLGVAFMERPVSLNMQGERFSSAVDSVFVKGSPSFPSQVVYLVCAIFLTVAPVSISFSSMQSGERAANDQREPAAVSYWIVESLGWPMTLLYFPARVGVVVIALLQIIRVFRMGEVVEVGNIETVFDGVNPAGAWWLSFLPHFG